MTQEAWQLAFDFDDTLIANTHLYHLCDWRCGEIVARALGHKSVRPDKILALQTKIDMESVAQFGFGRNRYPSSWVKAYGQLCGELDVPPDQEVKARLYAEASKFQAGPFVPLPDAVPTLRTVQEFGLGLHLITVGDVGLQNEKLDASELRPFFDTITIVERSKDEALAKLAARYPGRLAMAGDSKKSDIKPALALGIPTIWIPSNTWAFADAPDVVPDITLKSIRELPAAIRKLMAAKPH